MQCPEPLEGRFQPVRQCVIGRIHAGEQCVAARPRHLARIEHRAQCRRLVIRMVGVPAIPDIAPLLRLLAHLGDHRVSGHRSKEAVDIDLAKALRKRDMLLRCQLLVAEEHDPVIPQGPPDLGHLNLARRGREIDPGNLRADKGRERRHPDVIVGHTFLPTVPVPLRRNQLHDRPINWTKIFWTGFRSYWFVIPAKVGNQGRVPSVSSRICPWRKLPRRECPRPAERRAGAWRGPAGSSRLRPRKG